MFSENFGKSLKTLENPLILCSCMLSRGAVCWPVRRTGRSARGIGGGARAARRTFREWRIPPTSPTPPPLQVLHTLRQLAAQVLDIVLAVDFLDDALQPRGIFLRRLQPARDFSYSEGV